MGRYSSFACLHFPPYLLPWPFLSKSEMKTCEGGLYNVIIIELI